MTSAEERAAATGRDLDAALRLLVELYLATGQTDPGQLEAGRAAALDYLTGHGVLSCATIDGVPRVIAVTDEGARRTGLPAGVVRLDIPRSEPARRRGRPPEAVRCGRGRRSVPQLPGHPQRRFVGARRSAGPPRGARRARRRAQPARLVDPDPVQLVDEEPTSIRRRSTRGMFDRLRGRRDL